MSFGYRDEDWIDPPEPQSFRVTHRDCVHCNICPCGRHAWCDEHGEFIDPDESLLAWEDCSAFEASNQDYFDREADILADHEYDIARDLALEREQQ